MKILRSKSHWRVGQFFAVVGACLLSQTLQAQCLLNESQKITASDASTQQYYANSVLFDGDRAIAGAPGELATGTGLPTFTA